MSNFKFKLESGIYLKLVVLDISIEGRTTVARSSKKGPYIDEKLLKKVQKQKTAGVKEPIKTWARASQIPPEFVGHTLLVHNGRNFISVLITETMVGHRLGEFAPTRLFRAHGRVVAREMSKT